MNSAIAIVNAVTPSGWKEKALKVAAQLLVGMQQGAEFYAEARSRLDEIEGRSKVSAMLAEAVGKDAVANPLLLERARLRFLGDLYRKQDNVEAVISGFPKYLPDYPSVDSFVSPGEAPGLNPDFANVLTREAEAASTDDLRDRLSRILAGEVIRPGSYSKSTVRLVGELETATLIRFNAMMPNRMGNLIYREPAWARGDFFEIGMELQDAGLISGVGLEMTTHMTVQADAIKYVQSGDYALSFEVEALFQRELPVWTISRTGCEIITLLPDIDVPASLRNVAKLIGLHAFKKVILGRVNGRDDGMPGFKALELLWPLDSPAA